ncbi:MAG: M23/M56 family metallopeptidase [Bacteroidota bacterium]
MKELIVYLLKAMIVHGLLFSFYWFLLKRTTLHSYNRYFLIGSLIIGFIIPFISFPIPGNVSEDLWDGPVIAWLSEPAAPIEELILKPVKNEQAFSYLPLLLWFHGLIATGLLVRSLAYLFVLQKLKKHSETVKKDWFTLFKTVQTQSFSFFSNVFMPRSLFGSSAFDQVLTHECVHVRQFHSLDRLLLDFVVSLFWFNPFIYLFRNALIEIHEYQADAGVLKRFNNLIEYQEVLFSQLQSPQYSGLASHFNFQMIKKRIVMMNKQKKSTGWIYVLTVPVILIIIFTLCTKEAMNPLNEVGDEISSIIGPMTDVKIDVESPLQQNNTPSILPFSDTENMQMTSGFGMRMHPTEHVKKMHLGMDFACKIGSEVITTADGEVSEIRNKTDGYGKMVIIDHGNGFVTRYAQLSQFKVSLGNQVKKGQAIALSGNSGASTAPHLHYEIIKDGKQVNPATYIKNYSFKSKKSEKNLQK